MSRQNVPASVFLESTTLHLSFKKNQRSIRPHLLVRQFGQSPSRGPKIAKVNFSLKVLSVNADGSIGRFTDKTLLIDLWAAVKAINYAVDAKVKHFVMVSSIGADAPDNIESSIKPYLVAKHMADQHLINSELNYSIVRPGTLLNDAATGLLTTTRPATRQDAVINREDVADTLLYLAEHTPQKPQVFELFNGDKSIGSLLRD